MAQVGSSGSPIKPLCGTPTFSRKATCIQVVPTSISWVNNIFSQLNRIHLQTRRDRIPFGFQPAQSNINKASAAT